MNLITLYQHDTLISRFNSLANTIEKKVPLIEGEENTIKELHNEIIVLNNLFEESHLTSKKLRLLIEEYKKRQQSARVKLRRHTMKYAKNNFQISKIIHS